MGRCRSGGFLGFKSLRKENDGETVPMYYDLTQLLYELHKA